MKKRYDISISVVIPVYNCALTINDTIEHITEIAGDNSFEVIVADGEAAGSTVKAVTGKNVLTVMSEPGRGRQMNKGATLAKGRVLLFLHADTRLPVNAFSAIEKVSSTEEYVGGAFDLGFSDGSLVLKLIAFNSSLRSRCTRVPFGDQAIFLKRDYFERIGGYKNVPLMEDVELMKRIRKNRDRICILPYRVATSADKWKRDGILYTTLRNWYIQVLYALGWPPEKLYRMYYKKGV